MLGLADSLRKFICSLTNEGSAARDLEGKLHVIAESELEQLLVRGDALAVGLFSDQEARVLAENLHWSSRYRIFRLLRALRGAPLTPRALDVA